MDSFMDELCRIEVAEWTQFTEKPRVSSLLFVVTSNGLSFWGSCDRSFTPYLFLSMTNLSLSILLLYLNSGFILAAFRIGLSILRLFSVSRLNSLSTYIPPVRWLISIFIDGIYICTSVKLYTHWSGPRQVGFAQPSTSSNRECTC